jgi:hypothetical protein
MLHSVIPQTRDCKRFLARLRLELERAGAGSLERGIANSTVTHSRDGRGESADQPAIFLVAGSSTTVHNRLQLAYIVVRCGTVKGESIRVRVSPAEKAQIAEAARLAGRTVSDWCRRALAATLTETPVSEAALAAADASATMRESAPVGEGLEAPATGVGVDDSPSPESSPGPVSRLLEGRGR